MGRKLKTKNGRAVYARRKAIIEPVFGQIHTRQGKHVLLRGTRTSPTRAKSLCPRAASKSAPVGSSVAAYGQFFSHSKSTELRFCVCATMRQGCTYEG